MRRWNTRWRSQSLRTSRRTVCFVRMSWMRMQLWHWSSSVGFSRRLVPRKGIKWWVCFQTHSRMSSRIAEVRNPVTPDDLASATCVACFNNWGIGLLSKTWRVYRISPLQKNYKDESFIQNLIPSIQQHFQRNATSLDDLQLQLVLLHDMIYIDSIYIGIFSL